MFAQTHTVHARKFYSSGSLHGDIATDNYKKEVFEFRERHALALLIKQVRNLFVM